MSRRKHHVYGKLAPQAVHSTLLAEDGEANFVTKDKKDPSDFALWKAAKPGEPSWASPVCAGGQDGMRGRPGLQALLLQPLTQSQLSQPIMPSLGVPVYTSPTPGVRQSVPVLKNVFLMCVCWKRRLAHRVLGHGKPHAGAVHGYSHGRGRPGIPSP